METIPGVQARIAISVAEVRVVAGAVLGPENVDVAGRILAVAHQDRVGGDHHEIVNATKRKSVRRKGNTKGNVAEKVSPISRKNT